MLDYLRILSDTGMRRGELEAIKSSFYDPIQKIIILEGNLTKSGEPRVVLLTPMAVKIIERRIQFVLDGDERLFNLGRARYRRRWEYIRDLAGIVDGCMHTFRHTFASRLAMSGCNSLTLQELLGHSCLETTQRCAHLSLDAKREAIQKLMESTNYTDDSRNEENFPLANLLGHSTPP